MTPESESKGVVVEFREYGRDPWYQITVPTKEEALTLVHRLRLSGWRARVLKPKGE